MELRQVLQTLAESAEFRTAQESAFTQLSQNVETALYHAAMKGNVTAQSLWLKNRPPPGWNTTGADPAPATLAPIPDLNELSDVELITYARQAGLAIPAEFARIALPPDA